MKTQPLDTLGSLQWTPDGDQLFYASRSCQEQTTTVGRLTIADNRWEQARIPVGGSLGFLLLTPAEAASFFPDALTTPEDCTPPVVYPSGRTEACAFRF